MNASQATDSGDALVPIETARKLVMAIAEIAESYPSLAERRRAVLTFLMELVGADSGFWAWGRGWPDSKTVTPLAVIDVGIGPEQHTALMEMGLDAEIDRTFRDPILALMGDSRESTTIWNDIHSPAEWEAVPHVRRYLKRGGWSSWVHSVLYSDQDTWCDLFLMRNIDREDFGRLEAAAVRFVLTSVPWLHSRAEESLPPEAFVGLTPRQRMVMLMLLDGLARKTIAYRLSIGEDTVGDHIKSIYNHFKVGSATELAAHFLRGR